MTTFELLYPSKQFSNDLMTAVKAAHPSQLPRDMTRDAIHAQALQVGTWEFGPGQAISVWLDPDGHFKLEMAVL